MAKTPKVNKTQAVRDYLKDHPTAMSGEIAAALKKQRIKITPSHVANIKTKIKKERTAKKARKQQAAVAAVTAAPVEKKTGDTVTFEQIRAVTQTVNAVGGFVRVSELLRLIKEIGGLKKFKDLLEAMSPPEVDDIPF